jgi:hypothetical protein
MEKIPQTNLPHPFLPTRGKQLGPLHYMLSCPIGCIKFLFPNCSSLFLGWADTIFKKVNRE